MRTLICDGPVRAAVNSAVKALVDDTGVEPTDELDVLLEPPFAGRVVDIEPTCLGVRCLSGQQPVFRGDMAALHAMVYSMASPLFDKSSEAENFKAADHLALGWLSFMRRIRKLHDAAFFFTAPEIYQLEDDGRLVLQGTFGAGKSIV